MADYNNITLCKLGSEEGEEGDVYANITSTFCRLSSRDDGLYAALSLPFEGYLLERMACMQPHHPSLLNFERVVCMQPYSYFFNGALIIYIINHITLKRGYRFYGLFR